MLECCAGVRWSKGTKCEGTGVRVRCETKMGTVFCAVECVVYMNISSLQYKNQNMRMGKVRTIRKT